MKPWSKLIILVVVATLVGCRLQITVSSGGEVVSDSGQNDCAQGSICRIEVSDTNFRETFTAIPAPGYHFIGWTKGPNMLCGWTIGACTLETSLFANSEQLMAILDSDAEFYVEARFIRTDSIRAHQAGDLAVFSGTMTVIEADQPEITHAVTVRKTYFPGTAISNDGDVLAVHTTILITESGEKIDSEVAIWQNIKGARFDLNDEDGNGYTEDPPVPDSMEYGLLSIPAPLTPDLNRSIYFYTLLGGHTSGPITRGRRTITVSETESIEVPLGEFPVNKVTQADFSTYLRTYEEHERGSSFTVDRQLWVSPAKGTVRSIEVRSDYSSTGELQTIRTLDLSAVQTNY